MYLERAIVNQLAEYLAIDSAWRCFRRSDKPRIVFSEFMERARERCPHADPDQLRREFEARMSRFRLRS